MIQFFSKETYNKIEQFIKEAQSILLLSHLDADGLCSAGIIGRLLQSYDKEFTIRILKQLENDKELKETNADLIIITDMGSGQLDLIKPIVNDKKVIVIDHHQPQGNLVHPNFIHFNPDINDDSYSGSSLSFLVAYTLNPELKELCYLGLVGAIGDMQYNGGFKGLNKEIVDFGVKEGILSVSKGLNIFGRVSRPLHEALTYSFEIIIPGVSGNESGAIEMLSELNIDLKDKDGNWKTLATLSDAEMKKLVSNIVMRRISHKLDSDILTDVIEVNGKKGVLSDLKEMSVILNACGRQSAYGLGVLLCMGYEEYSLPKIEDVIRDYKKLIIEGINSIKNGTIRSENKDGILFIYGEDKIMDTLIGTIGGIILRDKETEAHTFIGFADRDEEFVKVSCRTRKKLNLGKIIKDICQTIGCTGGGHKVAGGALIRKRDIDRFAELMVKKIEEKHL